ncbi:MAG: Trm112 family protein [Gemmatimonadaceae bacterium]
MTIPPELLAILACPKCRGELEYRTAEAALICQRCRLRYPVRDGIPILLLDEALPL